MRRNGAEFAASQSTAAIPFWPSLLAANALLVLTVTGRPMTALPRTQIPASARYSELRASTSRGSLVVAMSARPSAISAITSRPRPSSLPRLIVLTTEMTPVSAPPIVRDQKELTPAAVSA
jgi:hypothetical protein